MSQAMQYHPNTPVSPRNTLDLVYNGRLRDVPPDELWRIVDSTNNTIATLTALVDRIEGYLASIDYSPPPGG